MKVVYIAGKFRDATPWLVEQHIRAAELVGAEVAKLGAMPLIPHANSRFINSCVHDDFWLVGTLELLCRCDAVMLVSNWKDSVGARGEVMEARERGIPVFDSLERLGVWLRDVGKVSTT